MCDPAITYHCFLNDAVIMIIIKTTRNLELRVKFPTILQDTFRREILMTVLRTSSVQAVTINPRCHGKTVGIA